MSLDDDDLDVWAAEKVATSRAAQGLPPKVSDPYVLRQIVRLLTPPESPTGWRSRRAR